MKIKNKVVRLIAQSNSAEFFCKVIILYDLIELDVHGAHTLDIEGSHLIDGNTSSLEAHDVNT